MKDSFHESYNAGISLVSSHRAIERNIEKFLHPPGRWNTCYILILLAGERTERNFLMAGNLCWHLLWNFPSLPAASYHRTRKWCNVVSVFHPPPLYRKKGMIVSTRLSSQIRLTKTFYSHRLGWVIGSLHFSPSPKLWAEEGRQNRTQETWKLPSRRRQIHVTSCLAVDWAQQYQGVSHRRPQNTWATSIVNK